LHFLDLTPHLGRQIACGLHRSGHEQVLTIDEVLVRSRTADAEPARELGDRQRLHALLSDQRHCRVDECSSEFTCLKLVRRMCHSR
jgi:hypothetical protein